MIYVQHLLGVGHLQRSLQLATELARHNFEVTLVSGGKAQALTLADGVRLKQLPPVYSPDGSLPGCWMLTATRLTPTGATNASSNYSKSSAPVPRRY